MNWLNYHHLYYFWTVAKHQSFTRAAAELRVAQSAVSLQVASLEDFLGKKLIVRSTSKKLSLTEEGQIAFRQAEEIFRQGKELVDGIKELGLSSSLRFGAIGSLSKNLQIHLLRPILEKRDLELSIDVGDSSTLMARLREFQLDAILCDVPYPHSENEPLLQRQIAREHYCIVGRKNKIKNSLSARLETNGVYLPAKSNPATLDIESYLKTLRVKLKINGYIDDIALLRLLALETDSLVAIPKIGAERELKEKQVFIAHEFRTLFQKFYLVLRHNSYRSRKILNLLQQTY
jgi:LysR family transcriptional regulator, transcriptional activator of nhaA